MTDLSGRVALVTGGAGGLGSAVARLLSARGADVAISDVIEAAAAEPLLVELRALGGRACYVQADVTVEADCARMAAAARDELGPIDVLFANAGLSGEPGRAWEGSEENWDRVLDVCLKGAWLTTKHVVPQMIELGRGRIVLTSSRSGLRAERHWAPYIAAKHGLIGLTKALALELGPHRINVNAVCPSGMGWASQHAPWWDEETGVENVSLPAFNRWSGSLDLFEKDQRMSFEEVAEGMVWLVSDAARTITGHALPLDDGWIAKRGG